MLSVTRSYNHRLVQLVVADEYTCVKLQTSTCHYFKAPSEHACATTDAEKDGSLCEIASDANSPGNSLKRHFRVSAALL